MDIGAKSLSKGAKMLIVDDEESMRILLEDVLGEHHQVTTVESVDQAEKALIAADFDVVLTDFRLPDKSGLALAEHVRKTKPSCAVILMTGHHAETLKDTAEASGVAAVIQKPFDFEEILRLIQRVLGH